MAAGSDAIAQLEAQRAYFASDERIRERAALWADATVEECLQATKEECEAAMRLLDLKPEGERDRILAPEPIPADTLAILESLQRPR